MRRCRGDMARMWDGRIGTKVERQNSPNYKTYESILSSEAAGKVPTASIAAGFSSSVCRVHRGCTVRRLISASVAKLCSAISCIIYQSQRSVLTAWKRVILSPSKS